MVIKGKGFGKAKAKGEVLFTKDPISFWGGVNSHNGVIIDPFHELHGVSVADKVFVYPFGKGSSGAGLVILEMARMGVAPKAIICMETEAVMLAGPCVSNLFYEKPVPVMVVDKDGFEKLQDSSMVTVDCDNHEVVIES